MMKQNTSKLLYEYWNTVRNQRPAPHRFEIEPANIATLLLETFIAECTGVSDYRIRLAGTRICDQFGRELRDCSLLEFWNPQDREGLANLLHNVTTDSAVGVTRFSAMTDDGRSTDFEMILMPLIHKGPSVNRVLGCITAIRSPFWLGTAALQAFELKTVDIVWPDGAPHFMGQSDGQRQPVPAIAAENARLAGDGTRQFKVYEGGLSDQSG